MTLHRKLQGILPVLPTPFTWDGAIDAGAMPALVDFVHEAGVDGVVFPGFASEVSELSVSERAELLEAVVERVAGRIRIVAGASARDAAEAVRHGQHAASLGIDHLMIQPPVELDDDLELLTAFFSEVADRVPGVSIVVQNAPAPRGSDLSPELICSLCERIPAIAYVKEESLPAGPAVSRLLEQRPSTLKGVIGGGGARYILDEYRRGACAANPALEIADLHVLLDRAWRTGRHEQARQIYVSTLPLLTLQAVYRMRLTKLVLMRRGVMDCPVVRAPTPEIDEFAIADIDDNLSELGIKMSFRAGRKAVAWTTG